MDKQIYRFVFPVIEQNAFQKFEVKKFNLLPSTEETSKFSSDKKLMLLMLITTKKTNNNVNAFCCDMQTWAQIEF